MGAVVPMLSLGVHVNAVKRRVAVTSTWRKRLRVLLSGVCVEGGACAEQASGT